MNWLTVYSGRQSTKQFPLSGSKWRNLTPGNKSNQTNKAGNALCCGARWIFTCPTVLSWFFFLLGLPLRFLDVGRDIFCYFLKENLPVFPLQSSGRPEAAEMPRKYQRARAQTFKEIDLILIMISSFWSPYGKRAGNRNKISAAAGRPNQDVNCCVASPTDCNGTTHAHTDHLLARYR